MMQNAISFVVLMVCILLSYMLYKLRGKNWIEYFKTKDGLSILKGIVLAPLVILLIGLVLWLFSPSAHAGTWLNEAGVFAGIDYTNKLSPSCEHNTVDERGTSNLGAWLNVWQSDSKAVQINSKYTHHSCILGKDDRQYDAVGVEVRWKIWSR